MIKLEELMTCNHGWTTPPECPTCVGIERDEMEKKIVALNRKISDMKSFLNALRLTHDLDVPEEIWTELFKD